MVNSVDLIPCMFIDLDKIYYIATCDLNLFSCSS